MNDERRMRNGYYPNRVSGSISVARVRDGFRTTLEGLHTTAHNASPSPQTYGLRNTSMPLIATEPGRPKGLPTPVIATTSGEAFRSRTSPLGSKGSVGKGISGRVFRTPEVCEEYNNFVFLRL